MKNRYKWDVDEMRHCITSLGRQKENLEQQRAEIESLRSDIEQAWQSIAGTVYEEGISIDDKLLAQIITSLDKEITKLTNVVDKYYQPCEETLRSKANNLVDKIRVL